MKGDEEVGSVARQDAWLCAKTKAARQAEMEHEEVREITCRVCENTRAEAGGRRGGGGI